VGVTEVGCLGDRARLVMHNLCTLYTEWAAELRSSEGESMTGDVQDLCTYKCTYWQNVWI